MDHEANGGGSVIALSAEAKIYSKYEYSESLLGFWMNLPQKAAVHCLFPIHHTSLGGLVRIVVPGLKAGL